MFSPQTSAVAFTSVDANLLVSSFAIASSLPAEEETIKFYFFFLKIITKIEQNTSNIKIFPHETFIQPSHCRERCFHRCRKMHEDTGSACSRSLAVLPTEFQYSSQAGGFP